MDFQLHLFGQDLSQKYSDVLYHPLNLRSLKSAILPLTCLRFIHHRPLPLFVLPLPPHLLRALFPPRLFLAPFPPSLFQPAL